MTRPTTNPTHIEAVADAAASSMRRENVTARISAIGAFCDKCGWGLSDSLAMMRNWVYLHNQNSHREEL
jgi:hypothetical protein